MKNIIDFDLFISDNIKEGYLRRIISSEINKDERIEDISKREDKLKNIKSWLDEMGVKNYTIDEKTLEIDVDGNVNLIGYHETKKEGNELPDYIKFREVKGNFNCSNNKLTSLKGFPDTVGGYFDCSFSDLISLKGCPKNVGGDFICSYNNDLRTLEGCPKKVGGDFICLENVGLKSLKGCPIEICGNFSCTVDTLDDIETGYNRKVDVMGDGFYCHDNIMVKKNGGKYTYKFTEEDILKNFRVKNVKIFDKSLRF